MSWNLGFWCLAFVSMSAIVTSLTLGVRAAIRHEVETHLRWIRATVGTVIGFVLAYAVKVIALGREDKTDWTQLDLTLLYTHEALIAVMLVAGLIAAGRGRAVYRDRGDRNDGWSAVRRRHAIAGRVCYAAAWLGWITGGAVLARMFVRA